MDSRLGFSLLSAAVLAEMRDTLIIIYMRSPASFFYFLLSFSPLFCLMGELFGIRRSCKDRGGAAALAGTNKLLHKSLFNFHFLVPPAVFPSCYGPGEVVTAALWARWNRHVFQSVWENTQRRLSGCGSGSLFALISPFTMI